MIYRTCPYCHARIEPGKQCSCTASRERHARYVGSDYINSRAIAIERADGKCEQCGKQVFSRFGDSWVAIASGATHHRVPMWIGGTDDASNLQVLCSRCHATADSAMRRGGR